MTTLQRTHRQRAHRPNLKLPRNSTRLLRLSSKQYLKSQLWHAAKCSAVKAVVTSAKRHLSQESRIAYEASESSLAGSFLDEERADSIVEWLAWKVGEDLAGATGNHMEVVSSIRSSVLVADGTEDDAVQASHLATSPTDDDRKSVCLPDSLYPFAGSRVLLKLLTAIASKTVSVK